MEEWLVKLWRWDGSTSVIDHFANKADAELKAEELNNQYQTNDYYVQRNWNFD